MFAEPITENFITQHEHPKASTHHSLLPKDGCRPLSPFSRCCLSICMCHPPLLLLLLLAVLYCLEPQALG
jgi:hypothetical protein